MKAIQMTEVGGPEVMKYTELDAPEPGPGQAQVEIKAAGVNYTDVYSRSGVAWHTQAALAPTRRWARYWRGG